MNFQLNSYYCLDALAQVLFNCGKNTSIDRDMNEGLSSDQEVGQLI